MKQLTVRARSLFLQLFFSFKKQKKKQTFNMKMFIVFLAILLLSVMVLTDHTEAAAGDLTITPLVKIIVMVILIFGIAFSLIRADILPAAFAGLTIALIIFVSAQTHSPKIEKSLQSIHKDNQNKLNEEITYALPDRDYKEENGFEAFQRTNSSGILLIIAGAIIFFLLGFNIDHKL